MDTSRTNSEILFTTLGNPKPNAEIAIRDDSTGIRPRLLKIAATATLLGVSTKTIERLHAAGKIPAPVSLCRDLLWDVKELNAWLDYAKRNGIDPPARKEWSAVYSNLLKKSWN